MNNSNDCVALSDDDNLIQVQERKINRKRKSNHHRHKKIESIETIVLDGETCNHFENNNVIELPDSEEQILLKLDKIHQEDKTFSDFIEKCFDLENSDGMIRIVHKVVVKAYEESDKEYRESSMFRRVLFKAIKRLETDPDHKFSHVKDLVETLKLHKTKKRLQLTTLATNFKDEEQRVIPTINLDDYENEVIEVQDEEKENHIEENRSLPNSQENFLVPRKDISWDTSLNRPECTVQQEVPIEYERPPPEDNTVKIKIIENQIMWCKEQITRLDEAEVEDDSVASPYIICEKYKVQVVQLYKQLCQLTGDQPVKRRIVRLQVLEGHPPGPIRRLETFINDNIGEDGIPLFPDFLDVIKCVMVANIEDKMGWNKQQVMREANSLFSQCGRALQKKRQKREYRDLLSRVKVELPEYDPAEEDLELQRKLEENRKVAVKNENDLLEKYVMLQYLTTQRPRSGPSLERVPNVQTSTSLSNRELNPGNVSQNNIVMLQPSPCSDLQNNQVEVAQPSPSSDLVSDEDSNFEPPEVRLSQETAKADLETKNKDSDVAVKQEPIDIMNMLKDLGNNYTMSVIDIEDPFLVIEISSDDESSEEEMHVVGESD